MTRLTPERGQMGGRPPLEVIFVGGPRDGRVTRPALGPDGMPPARLTFVEYEVRGRRTALAFHTYLRTKRDLPGLHIWAYQYLDPNPPAKEENPDA